MKRIWRLVCYRLWLLCGGRRTESGFRYLCKSIESNRKLIGKQSARIADLELRNFELEDHSPEEWVAECNNRLEKWTAAIAAPTPAQEADDA